jgi:hypothetical protein
MLDTLLRATRAHSLALAAPLSAETTWFFETLVLVPHLSGYRLFDERWPRLFNSYYESLGPRHARPQRGLLSRPSLAEVRAYRAHVDAALAELLPQAGDEARALIELGCHHEQQHQELLLTDLLHAFSCNPLLPAYRSGLPPGATAPPLTWLRHPGGVVEVGHGGTGFAFDN